MTLREIAKNGMKGRKKDTLLLKILVCLSFAFITSALIFQASMEQTKIEQKKELYGGWQAAYIDGTEEIYNNLSKEKEVKEATCTKTLGISKEVGIVGTMCSEFIHMGKFSLYKGTFPKEDNEIVVELNQLSNAGLDLSVGQKITLEIANETINRNVNDEVGKIADQARKDGYYLTCYRHRENPSTDIGDIHVGVFNEYQYYFKAGEKPETETIKSKGFLTNQTVVVRKEFTICGIINTYTDKWDSGGHALPNSFVTEAAGKEIMDAFYQNGIADVSEYNLPIHSFAILHSLNRDSFALLHNKYPDTTQESEDKNEFYNRVWGNLNKKLTQEEMEKIYRYYGSLQIEPSKEDTGIIEGTENVQQSSSNFRRNNFTYPDWKSSSNQMFSYGILGIIFITTVCAVFQIFLTQLKRRRRKLVLLKSIGATKDQLAGILWFEALYLWRTGLFFGAGGGLLLTTLFLYILRISGNSKLVIHVPIGMLTLGIVIGSVALFLGVMIPAISAVNIPLTGTMEKKKEGKDKSVRITRQSNNKKSVKVVRQNFFHITMRYMKNNRGKGLLSFAISLFIISMLTISLYLSYNSYQRYQNTVIDTGRPDYTLKAIYGENQRKMPDIEKELQEIQGVKEVATYKYGKQLLLWHKNQQEDPLLNTFEQLLPAPLKPEHFAKYVVTDTQFPEYIRDAYYTYYYGIDIKSEEAKKLISAVTEGNVDLEKFQKGEEVILMVPISKDGKKETSLNFEQSEEGVRIATLNVDTVKGAVGVDKRMHWLLEKENSYYTSFNQRYKNIYEDNTEIKPGDTLFLSADKEKTDEGGGRIQDFRTKEVTVGGIIHYFPEEGMWPFSDLVPYETVIGSMDGMESMYPDSRMGLFNISMEQMTEMVKVLYPTTYGRTLWNIKAEDNDNPEVLDAALLTYANQKGFTLYNYRESSEKVLGEAKNNILIITLLGLITSVIALIAFYNNAVSRMEQEKNRIGILQSMGVTKTQFAKQYIFQGMIQGIAAVVLTNVIFLVLLSILATLTTDISITSFGQMIQMLMAERLWLYPWKLHGLLCVLFVIIVTLLQLLPAMRIAKKYPVENIRSLGR